MAHPNPKDSASPPSMNSFPQLRASSRDSTLPHAPPPSSDIYSDIYSPPISSPPSMTAFNFASSRDSTLPHAPSPGSDIYSDIYSPPISSPPSMTAFNFAMPAGVNPKSFAMGIPLSSLDNVYHFGRAANFTSPTTQDLPHITRPSAPSRMSQPELALQHKMTRLTILSGSRSQSKPGDSRSATVPLGSTQKKRSFDEFDEESLAEMAQTHTGDSTEVMEGIFPVKNSAKKAKKLEQEEEVQYIESCDFMGAEDDVGGDQVMDY